MKEGPPGNGLHFPDLSIRGFRGFQDLSISGLGRVTLITGKNNTGKSSILEALRLHTQNAAPSVIDDILAFREENLRGSDEREGPVDPESIFHVSSLFHGFPRLSEDFDPIVISTTGRDPRPMKLTLKAGWFTEERDADGNWRLVPSQGVLFEDPEGVAALIVQTEERIRTHRLENFARYSYPRHRFRPISPNDVRMPCISVSSHGGEATNELEPLWNEIVLTDNERTIVEALRTIAPEIAAVAMVGGEPSRKRTAKVRAEGIPRPVPLRSFGDGTSRLFAIALSLVNASGGLLLVDEFENGLHHTVQLKVWRMIFRLAQSLDVQVFATTHSRDAVEAFQEAAAETSDEGSLVRLSRRDDNSFSTVLAEHELAVATRDNIEVR